MDLRLDVPGLSGNVEKDVKNLSNYVFQLSEQLRYSLYNLDVTNFNDLGLARYENGRLQIYTEKLQLALGELEAEFLDEENGLKSRIEADAQALKVAFEDAEKRLVAEYEASAEGLSGQIKQELGAAKEGIDEKVAQWQLTVDGFSTTFTTKLNEVDQTMSQWSQDADSFQAYVETAEGKIASWEVTEGKITSLVEAVGEDGEVTAASIVAAINEAGSQVVIDADHIDLNGIATFSAISEEDDYTLIDGAYIRCGSGYQKVEIYEGVITIGTVEIFNDSYDITAIDTHGGTLYVTSPNGNWWALTDNGWEEQ